MEKLIAISRFAVTMLLYPLTLVALIWIGWTRPPGLVGPGCPDHYPAYRPHLAVPGQVVDRIGNGHKKRPRRQPPGC
jgi:hypothetical protein